MLSPPLGPNSHLDYCDSQLHLPQVHHPHSSQGERSFQKPTLGLSCLGLEFTDAPLTRGWCSRPVIIWPKLHCLPHPSFPGCTWRPPTLVHTAHCDSEAIFPSTSIRTLFCIQLQFSPLQRSPRTSFRDPPPYSVLPMLSVCMVLSLTTVKLCPI